MGRTNRVRIGEGKMKIQVEKGMSAVEALNNVAEYIKNKYGKDAVLNRDLTLYLEVEKEVEVTQKENGVLIGLDGEARTMHDINADKAMQLAVKQWEKYVDETHTKFISAQARLQKAEDRKREVADSTPSIKREVKERVRKAREYFKEKEKEFRLMEKALNACEKGNCIKHTYVDLERCNYEERVYGVLEFQGEEFRGWFMKRLLHQGDLRASIGKGLRGYEE